MTRRVRWIAAGCLLMMAACVPGSRPTTSDAEAIFLKANPGASIVKIVMEEDEVVARSFAITHVPAGGNTNQVSHVHYLFENDRAGWIPTIDPGK